jgi:hypothetical protein
MTMKLRGALLLLVIGASLLAVGLCRPSLARRKMARQLLERTIERIESNLQRGDANWSENELGGDKIGDKADDNLSNGGANKDIQGYYFGGVPPDSVGDKANDNLRNGGANKDIQGYYFGGVPPDSVPSDDWAASDDGSAQDEDGGLWDWFSRRSAQLSAIKREGSDASIRLE